MTRHRIMVVCLSAVLSGCAMTSDHDSTKGHGVFEVLRLDISEAARGDGLIRPLLRHSESSRVADAFVSPSEETTAQEAMTRLPRGEARLWHNKQLGDMRVRPLSDEYPYMKKVCRDYTISYYGDTEYMKLVGWRDAGARRACRSSDSTLWLSSD